MSIVQAEQNRNSLSNTLAHCYSIAVLFYPKVKSGLSLLSTIHMDYNFPV